MSWDNYPCSGCTLWALDSAWHIANLIVTPSSNLALFSGTMVWKVATWSQNETTLEATGLLSEALGHDLDTEPSHT